MTTKNKKYSVSKINVQPAELPIKISECKSLSRKSNEQREITQTIASLHSKVLESEEKNIYSSNIADTTGQNNEPNLKVTGSKHKTESKLTVRCTKKFKTDNFDSNVEKTSQNYNQFLDDDKSLDEDGNLDNVAEDDSNEFSGDSNDGSMEDECTTPEYIYDEVLEDEQGENCNPDEVTSEEYEEENSCNQSSVVLPQNNEPETALHGNIKYSKPLKSYERTKNNLKTVTKPIKRPHSVDSTPQYEHTNRIGGAKVNKKTGPPKLPKINDKFPELPIPENINQYGDCLKTRLGKHHYGITLNDPPCQFFQGVLKGASGQTLATMFGDINLFYMFENIPMDEIGHFAIDTTFRVIPCTTDGVNHMLTISLLFHNKIIPLWYAITACSSPELYKRIIIEFQQHVLDWPFTSVLLNNDPILCKAVRAVFPDIDIYGSWFHYCYSIWKEINLNNLIEDCKTDNSTMMTAVKMLMVVPYLPPTEDNTSSVTMLEGFEVVRNFAEENDLPEQFNKVLDYVATFWFNKVKSKNFTTFGKQTNSLNYIEVQQLALLSYMKPNGNVWTLTGSFQNVAKVANTEFHKFLNGKPLLAKKNRGKKFNVPIRQNIKKLLMGTIDVKTYLEKSTIYCEEMLDIFLHPLYPTTTPEKSNYVHTDGWKTRICTD